MTLVTAYFDLHRREPETGRRGPDFYLRHAEFLFSLDRDIVFFVEPAFADEVWKRRAAFRERTRVVPAPLEDLPVMTLLPVIREAAAANPLRNADPAKDTPLFTAVTWSKFDLLSMAMEWNPFGASRFAWIDFGVAHVASTNHCEQDHVFDVTDDRVRLLVLRNVRREDVADRREFYGWLRGHVAAAYMTGGRESLALLVERFGTEAGRALEMGCAPLEEQILAVLLAESPELFDPWYGDYTHVLSNCVRMRGSAENLLFQLRTCRDGKDFEVGARIGERIVQGHKEGAFVAAPDVLSALLDEAFIAVWYRDHPDPTAARDVARYYAGLVERDPDFRAAFLRDEEHIRSNFSFLGEDVL